MNYSLDIGADYLAHHGILGMKWGKRKARPTSEGKRGFFDKPSVAKAVLLDSYGRKSSYTSKAALKKRVSAGRLRIASWATTLGGTALNLAVQKIPMSDQVKIGASYLSSAIGLASTGLFVGAKVQAIQAINQENRHRLVNE